VTIRVDPVRPNATIDPNRVGKGRDGAGSLSHVPDASADPILARRATIARAVSVGQRLGYGLFALAVALFFVGLATRYTEGLTTAIISCLVAGSVILAPAIVFGYGVKAAEREDRGLDSGH
jgi:hypothetical protein